MRDPLLATVPDRHASVHASAGTGKTWLLVTRLLRLLLVGVAPASILAVTFTRKASAEMLERLNARLAELAAADEPRLDAVLQAMGLTPTDPLRERARRLYETLLFEPRPLRATTFHAFCQEILQRFPVEAEVPPGFELQESEAELTAAAWDALYAEATQRPDGVQARALERLFDACGGLASIRQALNSFLSHRIDWWAFIQDQPDPLGYAQAQARAGFDCDPDADPISTYFSAARCAELNEFGALLGKHATKTNLEQQQLLQQAMALRELLSGSDQQQRLDLITRVLLTNEGEPRKRSSNKALEKSLGAAGCERLLNLHATLCNALQEVREQQARQASLALTCAWYRAGQGLLEHYQRIKREQRVLDFADLEWNAYRLLNSSGQAHWVQYKLDARIDHFLIDEFQDTNPTQWRLLLPLLQELAAGANERQRSVFLVGDAKQSIYRFRRADARLLEAASNWLDEHLQAQRFSLEASRRSAPAIIDCVNSAFSDGPLTAILPSFPTHSTHLKDLWGQVELLPPCEIPDTTEIIRVGLRNPLEEPRPTPADDLHLSEARSIAARIHALIDTPTFIGPADQARPARYRDVLILLRSRTHASCYEQALREAGIPYLGAARGTLLDSLEVRDLEALLNTLIAPHNDLALAQVLRSPLFDATNKDLVRLAQTSGSGWMERLLTLASGVTEDSALARAAQLLPVWQDLAGRLPVHDLLDRIYHEGDVLARFEAASIPALKPRVRANLIRFIELALEVDSGRYPSLPHFVARLGELRQRATDAPDDAPPESGGGDRVRFLTVHGAKGLESPVVFLADCGASTRDRSAWQALVDWPSEADRPETFILIGRKQQRDRLTQQLLDVQQQAELREDANLLYVALTRARQLLFVSAAVAADKADKGWYGLLRRQWSALAAFHPTASFVHSSGTQPTVGKPPIEPQPSEIEIDARLSQRLSPAPALLRIAPSRADVYRDNDAQTDPDGRRRGIGIHRLLEWLTTPPSRTRSQLLAGLARELQCDAEDPEFSDWLEEARAVLQSPDLSELFDTRAYTKAYTEVPLQYYQGNILVDGVIDRLLITTTDAHIIDYKSHRIDASQSQQSAARYREQLQLYVEGVRQLWPARKVRATILFTHCRVLVDL